MSGSDSNSVIYPNWADREGLGQGIRRRGLRSIVGRRSFSSFQLRYIATSCACGRSLTKPFRKVRTLQALISCAWSKAGKCRISPFSGEGGKVRSRCSAADGRRVTSGFARSIPWRATAGAQLPHFRPLPDRPNGGLLEGEVEKRLGVNRSLILPRRRMLRTAQPSA